MQSTCGDISGAVDVGFHLVVPFGGGQSVVRRVEALLRRRLREDADQPVTQALGRDVKRLAALQVPETSYYDDWPLTENGVGAVRQFLADVDALVADPPRPAARRIGVVTGTRMAEVIGPLLDRVATAVGSELVLIPVENGLFGPTVTTAGLLPGEDMRAAIAEAGPGSGGLDAVLIPAESLNDDELFIDSLSLESLRAGVATRVIPAHRLSDALAEL